MNELIMPSRSYYRASTFDRYRLNVLILGDHHAAVSAAMHSYLANTAHEAQFPHLFGKEGVLNGTSTNPQA